jgi:intein/homing endonuclease
MHFDTFSVYLWATNDHLIKTEKGWKKISKLKSEEIIYLNRNLMEITINYTPKKNIFPEGIKECTEMYGGITTGKYLKVMMSIIKMITRGIIELKILNLNNQENTKETTVSGGLKKIRSGLKNFILKELNLLNIGIDQRKASDGTKNMQKNRGLGIMNMERENVQCVGINLQQKNQIKNFAPINVNQNIEGTKNLIMKKDNVLFAEKSFMSTNIAKQKLVQDIVVEDMAEDQVYDLMVKDNHEYFANGILVHNCIDALRYAATYKLRKKPNLYEPV